MLLNVLICHHVDRIAGAPVFVFCVAYTVELMFVTLDPILQNSTVRRIVEDHPVGVSENCVGGSLLFELGESQVTP